MSKLLVVLGLLGALFVLTFAQNDPEHIAFCDNYDGDCSGCVKAQNNSLSQGGRCYFCKKTKDEGEDKCLPYGFNLPIAATTACPALNYHIDNCTVTALIYVIIICILIVLVLTCCCVFVCCCCCWCHRRRQRQRESEDEQYMQERDAIRQKSGDRRAERRAKNDEIRKKYGLNEDTTGTYKRLE